MNTVCVFCGSNVGTNPAFVDAAKETGIALVDRGLTLVYGGGRVGLMGTIADTVLAAGGRVVGIIPEALARKEVAHQGLSELHVVDSMHERKALMAEMSDAFIALPGGFGTFEEFCEMLTWAQLGLHKKPCGLLNIAGYYDPLLKLFDDATRASFVRAEHRSLVLTEEDPQRLLDLLFEYRPPTLEKWIDRDET